MHRHSTIAEKPLARLIYASFLPFLELSRPLARPPGAGRLGSEGFGWAWDRILRRKCGPGPWARARARPWLGPSISSSIRSQANPNPSTSSLPAPGGRTSGRLSSKRKFLFLSCVNECRLDCLQSSHVSVLVASIHEVHSTMSLRRQSRSTTD